MSNRTGPRGSVLAFTVALAWTAPLQAQTPPAPPGHEASFPAPAAPVAPAAPPAPPAPPAATAPPPAAAPATPPPPAAPPPAAAPAEPVYEPPPPPQKPEGPSRPMLSFRVDPFSWLFQGRLPLEMEVQLWRFISLEVVPVFVTTELSPSLNRSFDGNVTQHSDGIGALAGASLGVGFWLNGKPMRGTVLRAILTNYGYTYKSSVDEFSHTDRHFYGYLGSQSVWGIFTLAGGFGLGVELNKERRCFAGPTPASATSDCPKDQQQIAITDSAGDWTGDLNSWTHPIQTMFRVSLGVSF